MRSSICSGVRTALSAVTLAIVSVWPVAGQEPAHVSDTAKAIKELTGEVRSLRAAIERTSQSQLQGQVLGLYLNLQQNRVAQASARLDTVRRELDGIAGRTRELAQDIASAEAALAQEADPARRKAFEQQLGSSKHEFELMTAQEQQLRTRETEAYQASETEEARWTELISRLEQLLKK